VRVWSTKDGSAIGPAIQHVSPVGEIAFSRDGRFLATACQDHKVRLWSIPGLQLANTLDLKSFPTAIEFQAADLKLLTSEEIGLVTVWNNEGNAYGMAKQVRIRDHYLSHAQSSSRSSLVMTFGDSRIMSGHRVLGASSVFLIDMESESLLAPPQRHCSRIAQAELSQDGRFVISGSEDGTALLWQIVQDTGDPGWIEARATLCSGWVLKNQSQQIALDGEQTRALLEEVGGNRKLHQPDPNSLIRWNSFVGWLKDNCRRESPLENGF
jgi:WD40 repeat protein